LTISTNIHIAPVAGVWESKLLHLGMMRHLQGHHVREPMSVLIFLSCAYFEWLAGVWGLNYCTWGLVLQLQDHPKQETMSLLIS
jgi:hypothetical protein